ncbi:hypothetical protein [Polynucleobacter sp. MWH-Aus1W21]|uniref:hypothetical protein n=1 Tax=Polynucleobacter sp. MWH-Aus1W21 TaxID=1855880 RepID=UPI00203CC055|nr:hypothetical protein [Polynucleobacter sp. MWH-Aus1W21]
MNTYALGLASCLILMNISACTQAPPLPPGSATYSPYSAQQMKGFNNQTLSPVEGPFGPVDPRAEDLRLSKERALDSKYYSQPVGEQEAEAQETQSADPYRATRPVLTF